MDLTSSKEGCCRSPTSGIFPVTFFFFPNREDFFFLIQPHDTPVSLGTAVTFAEWLVRVRGVVKPASIIYLKLSRDFPGGPVAKTLGFHCRGPRFDPWSGKSDPACCMAQQEKKKKKDFSYSSRWQTITWGVLSSYIDKDNNIERQESLLSDLPGGQAAKTPGFQCRGPGFDPWSGN